MVCGRASSSSLKSSLPRFVTIAPFLSRTVASRLTTLTSTEMPGLSCVDWSCAVLSCVDLSCAVSRPLAATNAMKSAKMHSQEWPCHTGTGVQDRLGSELWRPKWRMKFLAPPEIIGSGSFGSPAQILLAGALVARHATDGDA